MGKINYFKLLILFLILIKIYLFFSCSDPVIINGETGKSIGIESKKEWTIMVYLDGANNLEQNAINDFNEMEYGFYKALQVDKNFDSKINIIVLFDRISGYYEGKTNERGENWTNSRIYRIRPDPDSDEYGYFTSDWIITDIDDPSNWDVNMGAVDSLTLFIKYVKKYFPANHYGLILWDHGGGARSVINSFNSISKNTKAVIFDEESNDFSLESDALYLDEVQQAIIGSDFSNLSKLDFVGIDACLMAEIEVGYELKNIVQYLVASMANEQGDGWDYTDILEKIVDKNYNLFSQIEQGKIFSTILVDSYYDSTVNFSDQTLSAIDLKQIDDLKYQVDLLAQNLYQLYNSSTDKNQFLLEFKNNILESKTINFSSNDYKNLSYYDLYDLVNNIKINYSSLALQCDNVIQALSNSIVRSYSGEKYGGYYGAGSITKRGLSIFFSSDSDDYQDQWWYTILDTQQNYGKEYLYGNIDFCNYDNDGVVETWKELMEAWYDPYNNLTLDTF